jgi:hypothetical protein
MLRGEKKCWRQIQARIVGANRHERRVADNPQLSMATSIAAGPREGIPLVPCNMELNESDIVARGLTRIENWDHGAAVLGFRRL